MIMSYTILSTGRIATICGLENNLVGRGSIAKLNLVSGSNKESKENKMLQHGSQKLISSPKRIIIYIYIYIHIVSSSGHLTSNRHHQSETSSLRSWRGFDVKLFDPLSDSRTCATSTMSLHSRALAIRLKSMTPPLLTSWIILLR